MKTWVHAGPLQAVPDHVGHQQCEHFRSCVRLQFGVFWIYMFYRFSASSSPAAIISEYFCFCKQLSAVLAWLLARPPYSPPRNKPPLWHKNWVMRLQRDQIWPTLLVHSLFCLLLTDCCVLISDIFIPYLMLSSLVHWWAQTLLTLLLNYKSWKQSWGWNGGKTNDGKSKSVKEPGVFKGLKSNVCTQKLNHNLSGTSVISKRRNICKKSLSHLKKNI